MITSHLALNERDEIVSDDLKPLRMLEPYLINPFTPNQHRIIQLARQGKSQKDICLILGRDPEEYRPYVSRVIRKAMERGVLQ